MREIKFSLSEGRYVSDTFAATGTSMAVRVEFEKAGSCTLMKSIDTGKFVPSAALLGYADDVKVVEKTILGVVPAQNFYIDFNAKAVPAKIYVLDGPSGGGGGEDVEALKALITQQGEKIDGISSAIGRQDTVLASHTGKLDSNGQKADEIAGKVEDVKGGRGRASRDARGGQVRPCVIGGQNPRERLGVRIAVFGGADHHRDQPGRLYRRSAVQPPHTHRGR